MKNYIILTIFITTLILISCEKEEIVGNNYFGQDIYKATLGIDELHWLPDGEHILVREFAQRTLKEINVQTKAVRDISIQEGFECDQIFVSYEMPDQFFYLAVKHETGLNTRKLFSYNLKTNLSTVIKENAPSALKVEVIRNPPTYVYLIKGNWIAISGDSVEFINLETGLSEFIPIPGDIQTFSPDGNQLLFYSREPDYQSPFKRKLVYDFRSHTIVPFQANDFSPVIWNNTGLYGFHFSQDIVGFLTVQYMVLRNYSNGTVLDTIRNTIGGPWSAFQNTQIIVLTFEEDGPTWYYPVLIAFDCKTLMAKEILRMERVQYSITPTELKKVSVSPDQMKIAYTTEGSYLRVNHL